MVVARHLNFICSYTDIYQKCYDPPLVSNKLYEATNAKIECGKCENIFWHDSVRHCKTCKMVLSQKYSAFVIFDKRIFIKTVS